MTGGATSERAGSKGADAGRGPTLGRASAWSRDLAIVGAATSFGAMFGIERQVKVARREVQGQAESVAQRVSSLA